MTKRWRLQIHGRVQGVGYRYFALLHARRLGVGGWVRNLPDASVAAEIQGEEEALKTFLDLLAEGPPGARVESIERRDMPPAPQEGAFWTD